MCYLVFAMGIAHSQELNANPTLKSNQVEKVVADQSPSTFKRVLPGMMKQLLVRMTGNSAVVEVPKIADQINQASDYVANYRYLMQDEATLLLVTFDQSAIASLLKQAHQLSWSGHRSATLFWVQVDDEAGTNVISSTERSSWHDLLLQSGQAVGLPVFLPLMDLQDSAPIDFSNTQDKQALIQAVMQRYDVNSVVVAHITQRTGADAEIPNFSADWMFSVDGQNLSWHSDAKNPEALLSNAIGHVAQISAGDAMLANTQSVNTVTLEVSHVMDLVDYAAVMDYLKTLPMIQKLKTQDMQASVLQVQLVINGEIDQLERVFAHDHRLIRSLEQSQEYASKPALIYSWGEDSAPSTSTLTHRASAYQSTNNTIGLQQDSGLPTLDHAVTQGVSDITPFNQPQA